MSKLKTGKRSGIVLVPAFYVSVLALWQILASLRLAPDYLFPSPLQVGERLRELIQDHLLVPSIVATLERMIVGFAISACIGLSIGVAMGTSWAVNKTLKSLFLGLQTLPTAAWVPVSLMIFGLRNSGIYFVVVMSSMSAVAIATSDGILNIPPIYLRAARTLGTPPWAMYGRVIVPAALPGIVTGIKLGWTLGWHGAISAELIKSSVGLGFLLYMGRELNDAAQIIGIMLLTILFGLLLDQFLFGMVERKIRRRWGLTGEQDLEAG
jgi:NitT/TauT family transport system permease protein